MLRRLQKCHTPKNTKNMARLHVNVLGGGVSLARPTASQIYFPIGDAVANPQQATKPTNPAAHPAG